MCLIFQYHLIGPNDVLFIYILVCVKLCLDKIHKWSVKMKINNFFGFVLIVMLVASCSDTPPSERVDETISATVFTDFDIGEYNKCFSTNNCTDIKTEELEDKLKKKYIILDGLVDEVEGKEDPNEFEITSCVSIAGNCLGYVQMGRLKQMNGGEYPFNCYFKARVYTKTDGQSNYIRNLGPGDYVKLKGEVSYISSYPSCKINMRNAIVVK